jgi:hypothetical protein
MGAHGLRVPEARDVIDDGPEREGFRETAARFGQFARPA